MTVNTIKITEIIFNQDFYPRDESQSPEKVNEYALSIADGKFPPILIDQNNNLLDGWHRWKAAGKAGLEELEAETLDTSELIYDGKPDMFAIKRKSAPSNCRAGYRRPKRRSTSSSVMSTVPRWMDLTRKVGLCLKKTWQRITADRKATCAMRPAGLTRT